MFCLGVVESRLAGEGEFGRAADHGDGSDDLIGLVLGFANGHVVGDLSHRLIGKKSSQQDVGVW